MWVLPVGTSSIRSIAAKGLVHYREPLLNTPMLIPTPMKIGSLSVLILFSILGDGSADVSFVAVSKTQAFAQFNPHIALLDVEDEDQDDPLSFEVFGSPAWSVEGDISSELLHA